jgi:hypothetical protein
MAFLGERARDLKFMDKVDKTARAISAATNPIDEVAKKQANGKIMKIIDGLAEGKEFKYDNVKSLVEAANDAQRMPNQGVAKERLEVLAYSTYIAMKHGNNVEMQNAVGTNDGAVIAGNWRSGGRNCN